ncbi:MAG: RNA polymerase sigma factor [Polyangiales bacterium]
MPATRPGETEDDVLADPSNAIAASTDLSAAEAHNLLARALTGDTAATGALIVTLTSIVQARVLRALVRRSYAADRRDVRQEIADLAQDVFCLLFTDDARILRMWRPSRGLSLRNYVGLIAERETVHALASGRRSPWALLPISDDALESLLPVDDGPEAAFGAREVIDRAWQRLEGELSPKGLALLQRLIVNEESVEEVSVALAMTTAAVYAWRIRLARRLGILAREADVDTSAKASESRVAQAHDPDDEA